MGTRVPGVSTGRWTPFCPVGGALRPDRHRLADLGDHHADLTRRNLDPGELPHAEQRPELEPQAGHEQRRLVARLAAERDRVALAELAERPALVHQPDVGRADDVEGLVDDYGDDRRDDDPDDERHGGSLLDARSISGVDRHVPGRP